MTDISASDKRKRNAVTLDKLFSSGLTIIGTRENDAIRFAHNSGFTPSGLEFKDAKLLLGGDVVVDIYTSPKFRRLLNTTPFGLLLGFKDPYPLELNCLALGVVKNSQLPEDETERCYELAFTFESMPGNMYIRFATVAVPDLLEYNPLR